MSNRGQDGRACWLPHLRPTPSMSSPDMLPWKAGNDNRHIPFRWGMPLSSIWLVNTLVRVGRRKRGKWGLRAWGSNQVGQSSVVPGQVAVKTDPCLGRCFWISTEAHPVTKSCNIPLRWNCSGSHSLKVPFRACVFKSSTDFMSSVTSCNNPFLNIICNGFCGLQHNTLTDRGNLFGKSYWKNPYWLLKGSHFLFLPVSLFQSDCWHEACGLYTFLLCGCHYLSFEFWGLILVPSSVRKECE